MHGERRESGRLRDRGAIQRHELKPVPQEPDRCRQKNADFDSASLEPPDQRTKRGDPKGVPAEGGVTLRNRCVQISQFAYA